MKTTYYLFDAAATNFNELLKLKFSEGEARYEDITKPSGDLDFEYKILIERNKSKRPGWTSFLKGYADEEACNELANVSNSFVVLLKIPHKAAHRFFAITGGAGHGALNRDLVEQNFGLMTALNTIDPEKINYFDAKNIDARGKQKRVTATHAAKLADIDFDADADLINSVSGSAGAGMGEGRITGSGSLSLQGRLTFSQLGEACKALLENFESDRYKQHFGFVNNISLEKNKRTISLLDEMLVKAMIDRRSDATIGAAYPVNFRHASCSLFKINGNNHDATAPFIDLDAIYAYLDEGGDVDVDALKQRIRIAGFSSDSPDARKTNFAALYSFLNFETEYHGRRYALSHRRWYSIESAYLEYVLGELESRLEKDVWQPQSWGRGQNPQEYAKARYSADEDYLIFDRMASVGSNEVLSMPDLFHLPSRRAIIIERSNHSATLGDMLDRGKYTAEQLRGGSNFRTNVMHQIEKRWGKTDASLFRDMKLVFAVGVPQKDMTIASLPAMAQINILKHTKYLQKLGYPTEVTFILPS